MAADRHEYWAERWRRQKEDGSKPDRHDYWKKRWEEEKGGSETFERPEPGKRSGRKDRHRKGYYHDYNKAHPERLERGFTKGYVNGNVSEGPMEKRPDYPDGCIKVLGGGYYFIAAVAVTIARFMILPIRRDSNGLSHSRKLGS